MRNTTPIHYALLATTFLVTTRITAQPAFPGAEGFGAAVTGGRGGQVIYVTNLDPSGPGSFQEALETEGARYILFKISGVIPVLAHLRYGNCTIAGQTSPGGIIVRGFLADDEPDFDTPPRHDNWSLRFIHSRTDGQKHPDPLSLINDDAFRTVKSRHVIVDHCSFARADDECMQISETSNLTVQNCILAETPGDHSSLGGMLINYTSPEFPLDSLSIHHNTWNRIEGRLPEISRESPSAPGSTLHMELSSNLIWDNKVMVFIAANTGQFEPQQPIHYDMNIVENLMRPRDGFTSGMFTDAVVHDSASGEHNNIFMEGNELWQFPTRHDWDLFYCCNDFDVNGPSTDSIRANRMTARHPFPTIGYTPPEYLTAYMSLFAGAMPRDPMDRRLMRAVESGRIDSISTSDVNAMPDDALTLNFDTLNPPAPPLDSDNDGMPDWWERANHLDPNTQDHNGTSLSVHYTGVTGYTNLECYLNALADSLVRGNPTTGIDMYEHPMPSALSIRSVAPNPMTDRGTVRISTPGDLRIDMELTDMLGRTVQHASLQGAKRGEIGFPLAIAGLPAGTYILRMRAAGEISSTTIVHTAP